MSDALIAETRKKFHRRLIENGVLTVSENGTVSNADSSSASSKAVALRTAEIISGKCRCRLHVVNKPAGQTLGRQFEVHTADFLSATFLELGSIRPGKWNIACPGLGVSTFTQYEHLAELSSLINCNPQLAAALGNDYVIAPDIVIYRERYTDDELNVCGHIVNMTSALASDIRAVNGTSPVLHAVISAKYTMRSDRAQNSRTEAFNLSIRILL